MTLILHLIPPNIQSSSLSQSLFLALSIYSDISIYIILYRYLYIHREGEREGERPLPLIASHELMCYCGDVRRRQEIQ